MRIKRVMQQLVVTAAMFFQIAGVLAAENSVYKVAVRDIPETIDVRTNRVNTRHYINIHLYHSLFTYVNNELSSAFLDMQRTGAGDTSFKNFAMCLKAGLQFSDGSPITKDDLASSLAEIHGINHNLDHNATFISSGDCVKIQLTRKDYFYFDKLVNVQSTVLKKGTSKSPRPVGYGPYKLTGWEPQKIAMNRSVPSLGGIERVEFIKYTNDADAEQQGITDWNHIYQSPLPDKIKSKYSKITRPISKTYVILARIRDPKIRSQLLNCFPVEQFVSQTHLELREIPGFLPTGMMGYDAATPKVSTTCSFTGAKAEIKLTNADSSIQENLVAFFSKVERRLPVKITPVKVTAKDIIHLAYESDEQVLITMALEAADNDIYDMFRSFVESPVITGEAIAGLKGTVEAVEDESGMNEKRQLYKKAHSILLNSGYVIPLGQVAAVQYYPPWIDNIQWNDKGQGFPQISLMKVK